jgi:ribonuclease P protein component
MKMRDVITYINDEKSGSGVVLTITQVKREREPRYTFRGYNHIRTSRDYQLAAEEGSKIHDKYLVVNYRARGDSRATRLGIITTRKLGKAVRRNRLRRLVREAFRLSLPHMKRGFDIVVIVRKRAVEVKFVTIQASLLGLLKRAGILEDVSSTNNR